MKRLSCPPVWSTAPSVRCSPRICATMCLWSCTVMSVDPDCSPEIAALIGTSIALSISDIPWARPHCRRQRRPGGRRIDHQPQCGTAHKSRPEPSPWRLPRRRSCMIEAGANEVADDIMLERHHRAGHRGNTEDVSTLSTEIQAEIGKAKFSFESKEAGSRYV